MSTKLSLFDDLLCNSDGIVYVLNDIRFRPNRMGYAWNERRDDKITVNETAVHLWAFIKKKNNLMFLSTNRNTST